MVIQAEILNNSNLNQYELLEQIYYTQMTVNIVVLFINYIVYLFILD